MGISMADTGTGYAVGDVDVILGHTGILRKTPGDPTWRTIAATAFAPALNIALTSWAQDVHAVPGTSIAFISWRDDYRSLVYKTTNGGITWFSVSPLNPILYGTRFAVYFKDVREGMIVGEGPGRAHRTLDGGVNWTSYTIPVQPPLTDVKFTGTYWVIAAGQNIFYRYNPINNRWYDLSFTRSTEYFPTHLKLSFVNDNYGYLNGYNQNNPLHVLKTTNGGLDWAPTQYQPNFAATPEGHKGVFFFDSLKGWVSSRYDEFAYTEDGGFTWYKYMPQVFGGKPYPPVNKMVFLNEAFGWAVGGPQRTDGYPSVSYGWIMKWVGTQKPDISTTPTFASFDTMACQESKDILIPIRNSGTGSITIFTGGITFNDPAFSLQNVSWPIIIPPGNTHEVEVRWEPGPDYYGAPPAGSRMSIVSSDNDHTPWHVDLYGTRLISRLVPRAGALVFPPVCSGEKSEATLKVDVFGNVAPTILDIALFSDRGSLTLLSHTLGDRITGTDSLRLALSSGKSGTISGNILITAGNPDCPDILTIPFQCLIQSNEMKVVPELVQFKDVCAGDDVVQYVQVKNEGNVPGRIREFKQYGGDSLFTLEVDTSLTIEDGQYVLLALRYHPKKADSLSTTAQFRMIFSPCSDTLLLACSGRGVEAFMELETDSILVVGPAPLDRQISTTVQLRNTGFLPTTIEEVWFDPPVPGLVLVAPTNLPLTVRPKESIDVSFIYQASNRDSVRTTLRVRWSDPCAGSLEKPVLLISDEMPIAEVIDAVIFKTQTCEEDVLDSVFVHNSGQKPLVITSATIGGSSALHFRVTAPKFPLSIDPGASAWIYLAYNAPTNGGSSASLVLRHNDLTVHGESVVQLNGRKKVLSLTLVGDTLGMLQLCHDVMGSRRFVLRNDNSEVLLLASIDVMKGSPFVTLRSPQVPTSVQPGGSFELWADVTLPLDTVLDVELRVLTEPCRADYTIRFKAGVPVPLLTVEPSPLALGTLPVTDTSVVAVRIRNSDTLEVVVDSLILRGAASAMYLVQQLSAPRTLRPGEALAADLKLRLAKDTGAISGTLCAVLSSPCPDTICFDVSAQFIGTPFAFSADTLTFTFAFCDTLLCDTVRITNALTVPQLLQPAISNAAVFSVEPDTAILLEAGEGATFRICARKPVLGIARGELLLQSNAAPLSAVALVAVRQDQGLLLPDTVDAGNIPGCETDRLFSIPIENRGGLEEIVFDVSSSDGVFVLESALSMRIAGHASDTLRMRFTPSGPGVFTALLTIRSRSGSCERRSTLVLRGRASENYIVATPSTLLFANVVAGTAQSKTLNVMNSDMDGLRLAAIDVQPNAQFTAVAATPVDIPKGTSADISVVFQAADPGNYFGTLCLIFDRPCPDTVCVALEGIAIDGDLLFSLPQLRFDSLAFCQEEIDTVMLQNSGNIPVILKSSSINGSGAAGYTLLNPVTPDEQLAANSARPFYLRFRAADVPDGSATASLFVTTDAVDQPLLELPLFGTRVRFELPQDIVLNLGQLLLGSPVNIDPAIMNTGDATLEFLSLIAHSDYSNAGPAFPYQLYGKQSAALSLMLVPSREGVLDDTLRIPIDPCGGEFRLIVRGTVLRQYVQGSLDFGDVPACETRSGIVTILNNGSTPIILQSMQASGALSSAFRIENLPTLPHTLDPGVQLTLTISMTPLPGVLGPYVADLLSQVLIAGKLVAFKSELRAMVRDGGLVFTPAAFLGSGELGTEYPGILLVGTNTATFPVRVEEIQFPSPQLRLLSATPATPVDILPGDSLVLALAFIPDRIGMRGDSFTIRYSAPCATTLPVSVTYEGYGDLLPTTLSAGTVTGAPDDTVDIPLLLNRDITGLNISEWQGSLRFNASMLYPLAVRGEGTLSASMQLNHAYDQATGTVSITAAGGRLAGTGDVLVYVRCLVLVGSDSSTALEPEAATFAHPAVLIDRYAAGRFDLMGYCLADGTRLIGRSGGLLMAPPVPNPAQSSAELRYNLPRDGEFTLVLYDARGRAVSDLGGGNAAAGEHFARVDCSTLPAGTYLIVLRSGEGIVTEKMTVVR